MQLAPKTIPAGSTQKNIRYATLGVLESCYGPEEAPYLLPSLPG